MHLCRNCSAPLSLSFADLGRQPPSNALLTDLDQPETIYPLHAYVCEKCWLVQLPNVVDPKEIFNDHYAYFSSNSKGFLAQCEHYATRMSEMLAFTENPLVVEIASNDGYLLQYFRELGIAAHGVEPSANVAAVAQAKGIPTEVAFFGAAIATSMAHRGKTADLIVANNVFAHVPDIHDFAKGLRILLKPNGTATIEVPHLLNLIKYLQFDTIYHEHYSYFWLYTLVIVLRQHDLRVFHVEKLPNLGGSLRVFISHWRARRPIDQSVIDLLEEEIEFGCNHQRIYSSFQRQITGVKLDLMKFFVQAHEHGRSVAGYGAPAKATVLLNYCGIGPDLLPYVVDTTPYKQGKYIPGVQIPIFHEDHIFADKPDYVLLFPWNLRKEIVERIGGQVREWGGRFVTAIPELEIF